MSDVHTRRRVLLGLGGISGVMASSPVSARQEDPSVGIVGDMAGTVHALEVETGATVWQFESDHTGFSSSPTVVEGTVFIGSRGDGTAGGSVFAIDAATGDLEWEAQVFAGWVRSSPTVIDDTVYIGGPGESESGVSGSVYALEAATGDVQWSVTGLGPATVDASPAVVDDTVYVGATDYDGGQGGFYALETASGDELWSVEAAVENASSAMTVIDGLVIGVDTGAGGDVYGIDEASGDVEWTSERPAPDAFGSPTPADELVLLTAGDVADQGAKTVYALEPATGELEWETTEPDGQLLTSPVVVRDRVYVGGTSEGGGALWALETGSGDTEWTSDGFTSPVASTPTVASGLVFVCLESGVLQAIDAENGEPRWDEPLSTSGVTSSPTVVSDPSSGHSVDARVERGTLGHHHHLWDTDGTEDGDPIPGFGMLSALTAVGGGAGRMSLKTLPANPVFLLRGKPRRLRRGGCHRSDERKNQLSDDRHWHVGVTSDAFGDTPEQDSRDARPTLAADDNLGDAMLVCVLEDRLDWRTLDDVDADVGVVAVGELANVGKEVGIY